MTTATASSAQEVIHLEGLEKVCELADLATNSGVCALLGDSQVAIFTLPDLVSDKLSIYALSNWDPIGKANVMYRGILGSISGEPVICSPLYKQHYSLLSGACFEDENARLTVYQCEVHGDNVFIGPLDQKHVAA